MKNAHTHHRAVGKIISSCLKTYKTERIQKSNVPVRYPVRSSHVWLQSVLYAWYIWYDIHGIKNRNDRLNSLKVWVFTNHCVYESTGDLKLQENGKKYPQAFSASLPSRTAYYCCWCSSFCIITKNTHDTHILHLHHRSIPAFDNNACMLVPVLWCYDIPGMLDHIIAYIIYYTWYVIWCLRWWWWCVWRFDVFIGLMMVHTIILLCCAWSMYEYTDGLSWFQVIIHDRSWWRWCIVRAWMNSNNKQATNKRTSIIAQQFHTYSQRIPPCDHNAIRFDLLSLRLDPCIMTSWLTARGGCVVCRVSFFSLFFQGLCPRSQASSITSSSEEKVTGEEDDDDDDASSWWSSSSSLDRQTDKHRQIDKHVLRCVAGCSCHTQPSSQTTGACHEREIESTTKNDHELNVMNHRVGIYHTTNDKQKVSYIKQKDVKMTCLLAEPSCCHQNKPSSTKMSLNISTFYKTILKTKGDYI